MSEEIAYSRKFSVLWSDLDPNGHMRGARYIDYAGEMPFYYLLDNGFDLSSFIREQVGPVTFNQGVRHLRELRFADELTVHFRLRGLSPDGARWAFRCHMLRGDGQEVAVVDLDGAFFGRLTRKMAPPPAGLPELIGRLQRESDFTEL